MLLINFLEYLSNMNMRYLETFPAEDYVKIFNNENFVEIDKMFDHFIKPIFKQIGNVIRNDINTTLTLEYNFRLSLFICFNVFIIIGYLITWLPLQIKISDEIVRTKKMFEIIPAEVKEKMISLKDF